MKPIPLLVVAAFLMAGCLQDAPAPKQDSSQVGALLAPLLTMGERTATGTEGLLFNGTKPGKYLFHLELPDDYWSKHTGNVEVALRWHFTSPARYTFDLLDASGRSLGPSRWSSFASILLVPELKPGTYIVNVKGPSGTAGAFEGVIQVESLPKDGPVRERLPNLAALAPDDLSVSWLLEEMAPSPSLPVRGCWPTETAEKQHLRCLRVSSAVGNAGEGVLQIHMKQEEGAKAAAGLGRYTQRIFKTDGSYREEPVGLGQFHPTHGHFHYNGLAQFTVYKYDLTNDQRGDKVAQSRKNGFCLIDMGLIRLGVPGTTYAGYRESACLLPDERGGWIVGLSPSWYDLYDAWLDDQSVNMFGVPDGIYELVYTVNADKTIKETSLDDNDASTIFKLTGDNVKVIKKIEDGRHIPVA